MSNHTISPEITYNPEVSGSTKVIWKTFWILSALTVAELIIGYVLYFMHKGESPNQGVVLGFKALVCILTLAKAFYIVAVFMHLGAELRNFIMTITVTLGLFVWFIIAFLWDGNSWKNMKNTNAGSREYKIEKVEKLPAVKEGVKQ